MIVAGVTWQDQDMRAALRRMKRKAGSLGPVLKELRGTLRADLKAHGAQQESPDGKWAPRAAASKSRKPGRTKSGRRRAKRKLLGRLLTAINFNVRGKSLIAMSKVRWSMAHQDGGRVGHGAVLPARPFIFISPTFAAHANQRIRDYVLEEWGRQ